MEALSPTMEEGRLVEWKKQEGEAVAVGDVLAEVETDKAVMELVARAGGTLLKHIVEAGSTVPVSEPVAVIGDAGEEVSGDAGKPGGEDGQRNGAEAVRRGKTERGESQAEPKPAAPAAKPETRRPGPQMETGGRVKASPLARRMAAERGLDLQAVPGSGPEGRIVARDLEGATAGPATAPASAAPLSRTPVTSPYNDVPLTQIRKTIAKRLIQSIGPIPTFYLTTEVDMERVWDAREALRAPAKRESGEGEQAVNVSFNDIIIKAVAMALRQHPACNAWWQDDHIRYWNEVHISMAVAIEDLASLPRERRLKPEEYTGGTFSLSNLGMLDIEEFTAVINPPETGIIAVGRIAEKAVAHDGGVALRRRMRLTMSCDHRVIDGATGAEFLKTLKGMLENPLALVW
jgi:pyruvate dehydrogenase E2 component (dihydrolipoamide acetyltransferase)